MSEVEHVYYGELVAESGWDETDGVPVFFFGTIDDATGEFATWAGREGEARLRQAAILAAVSDSRVYGENTLEKYCSEDLGNRIEYSNAKQYVRTYRRLRTIEKDKRLSFSEAVESGKLKWSFLIIAAPEDDDGVYVKALGDAIEGGMTARGFASHLKQLRALGPADDHRGEWTEDELSLRAQLEAGRTVVVNMRNDGHPNLVSWAKAHELFERIDRETPWGNPFQLGEDGDRETVVENYEEHYLPHKPSLQRKLGNLRGKALGCWCAPEICHGHVLQRQAYMDAE